MGWAFAIWNDLVENVALRSDKNGRGEYFFGKYGKIDLFRNIDNNCSRHIFV